MNSTLRALEGWLDEATTFANSMRLAPDHGLTLVVGILTVCSASTIVLTGMGTVIEILALGGASPASVTAWRHAVAPLAGEAIGAIGLGLVAGTSAFSLVAAMSAVWPLLDIVHDVESYLDDETRARIDSRADALFTELAREHDKVILVAHSQGSVIACDLLRRIADARRETSGAEPLEIVLITCGSPLGHLYRRFFPMRFAWIDEAIARPTERLGVSSWCNYGALADFVGMRVGLGAARLPGAMHDHEVPSDEATGHTEYFTRECKTLVRAIRDAIHGRSPCRHEHG